MLYLLSPENQWLDHDYARILSYLRYAFRHDRYLRIIKSIPETRVGGYLNLEAWNRNRIPLESRETLNALPERLTKI